MEQWSSCGHLGKDATDTPDVDGTRVAWRAQKHLGRSVPKRDDFVRVNTNGNAESTRQTEIGELDHAVLVDEQILGLQVTVHGASLVTVEDALRDLMQVALDQLRFQQPVVRQGLHVLFQVHGEKLEYQIEFVLLHENVHERDDVGMLKFAEKRNLSNSRARYAFLVILQANLLERHKLIGDLVLALVDDTVGALANLLDLDVVGQRVADRSARHGPYYSLWFNHFPWLTGWLDGWMAASAAACSSLL